VCNRAHRTGRCRRREKALWLQMGLKMKRIQWLQRHLSSWIKQRAWWSVWFSKVLLSKSKRSPTSRRTSMIEMSWISRLIWSVSSWSAILWEVLCVKWTNWSHLTSDSNLSTVCSTIRRKICSTRSHLEMRRRTKSNWSKGWRERNQTKKDRIFCLINRCKTSY